MNRIIYSLLLPVIMLAGAPVSASSLTIGPFSTSNVYSDTTGALVVASTYSGRRTDTRAQHRLRQNTATQNQSAEFSAFETEQKATTTRVRHQHRYGGRGPDHPRTQH